MCHTADSCAGVSRHAVSVCLQAAEGVYRDAGAAGGDHGGLLADAVGTQLHHRGDADQTARDGTGEKLTHSNLCSFYQLFLI